MFISIIKNDFEKINLSFLFVMILGGILGGIFGRLINKKINTIIFQKLFLIYEYLEDENIFIIKRKDRKNTEKGLYLAVSLYTNDNVIGDLEYEIDNPLLVRLQKTEDGGVKYIVSGKTMTE